MRGGDEVVTTEEKKAYLSRPKEAWREINELEHEREYWRNKAERITPLYSDMPKESGNTDHVGNAAVKIARLDKMINERMCEFSTLWAEIWEYINVLEDDTLRRVLFLRYMCGLTLMQTAKEMNYSYVHVCRLIDKAIEKLGESI